MSDFFFNVKIKMPILCSDKKLKTLCLQQINIKLLSHQSHQKNWSFILLGLKNIANVILSLFFSFFINYFSLWLSNIATEVVSVITIFHDFKWGIFWKSFATFWMTLFTLYRLDKNRAGELNSILKKETTLMASVQCITWTFKEKNTPYSFP